MTSRRRGWCSRSVADGAGDGWVSGVGVGAEHAPLPGEVPDALGRHDGSAAGEPERVLGRAVVVEDAPVALEVARVDALVVLVEQREDVDVGHLGAARRALPREDAVEEALVEALRVGGVGVLVAVGGPADLADDDGDGAEAVLVERGDERVVVGVEDVGVEHVAVAHASRRRRRPRGREEGVVDGEVGVGVEGEERVDVDGEDAAVVEEEADEAEHEARDVGAEVAGGRAAVEGLVDVGVERDGDVDLAGEPGLDERGLHVLHGGQRGGLELALVGLEEGLVADGDVADVDAVAGDVGGDVLENPLLGGVDAGGDGGEQVVGEAEHDLDARVAQRPQRRRVGLEELHAVEAVVAEEADGDVARQGVQRAGAPVGRQPRLHGPRAEHHRVRRRHPQQQRQSSQGRARTAHGCCVWTSVRVWGLFAFLSVCKMAVAGGDELTVKI
ncbi:hypothetical protein U9M48_007623 [Paspalum notatum var. saurae]|uniref:Uncharacterized protein n=1 Tax=Paspalum notatum var. saurae TaxID=547442 RepID=A0AAQ3SMM2_PASNO